MSNTIKKNQKADIPTKNGKNYSYQYVDIAQIHEYLESINSKYIQKVERIDGDDYIMTKRCFDNKWEDEWLQGSRVVDATLYGNDNPAQKQGSALTYARRYSLLMAYGLATEDDDANLLNNFKEITKDQAMAYKFGEKTKHPNETIMEVLESDPGYLQWHLDQGKFEDVKQMITLLTGMTPTPIPSEEEQELRIDLISEIQRLSDEKNVDIEEVKGKFKVESLTDMTTEQMNKCIRALEKAEVKND